MQPAGKMPDILASWMSYIDTYDHLVAVGETRFDEPTQALKSAFAGALVASLLGGVADPAADGRLVALAEGECAVVHLADMDGESAPAPLESTGDSGTSLVALVIFRRLRPVAVHVLPSAQLHGLAAALGPGSQPTLQALHHGLQLEPAIAREHGVLSRLVTTEGLQAAREPRPQSTREPAP